MKLSFPLVAITAAISTGVLAEELSPDTWKDAYSKRNVRLGITLDEFRKIPFPDPDKTYHYNVPSPKCSNDPVAQDYIFMQFCTPSALMEQI